MRIFVCPACGERVFFENLTCACGADLAYDPDDRSMVATATFCANRGRIGCNWVAEQGGLCRSCAMTRTHPDISVEDNATLWRKAEAAKRWVLENLAGFGWFTPADHGMRPVFEMMSERVRAGTVQTIMAMMTG